MVNNKNCGIYKITSPSGRIYIGQSINLEKRFKTYRNGHCKKQPRLINSFKKYGVENHQFDIIEYCAEEQLNCSERFWQDEFDVLNGGLNCILQECGQTRKIYSEELKKLKSEKTSLNKKVIDLKTLETYPSIISAANTIGMSASVLGNQLKGKFRNKTNFLYYSEYIEGKQLINPYPYRVINKDTGVIYETVVKAAKFLNMNSATLTGQLRGTYTNKTSMVYYQDYLNNTEPIKECKRYIKVKDTISGTIYNSVFEASKAVGVNHHTLRDYLAGNCKNKTSLIFYKN